MKILLYCPLAPSRPRIYARTMTSIMTMDWPHAMPVVFGRNDTPVGSKYVDICAKHNEARQMTLDGNFDALFLVENDMVIPADALTRLTALDADVAYGLYVARHGLHQWLCYTYLGDTGGVSLTPQDELRREVWGKPFASQGVGMGCTLIHRHVLEAFEFRTHPDDDVADDWMFSLDCIAAGFRQVHDLGVVCGHIAKPQSPRILWPDPDAEGGYRIEWFNADKQLQVLQPGETATFHINGFTTEAIYGSVS